MTCRLERLVTIDKLLRTNSFPGVAELCALLEIKPRTLFQDIRELRERMGLDIRFDKARSGYYNASPEAVLPDFNLSEDEYLLLLLGQSLLKHLGGPSFEPLALSALQKVAPNSPSIEPEQGLESVAFVTCSSPVSAKLFLDILRATMESQPIEMQVAAINGKLKVVPHYVVLTENSTWEFFGKTLTGQSVTIPLSEVIHWRHATTNDDMCQRA